jgi:hypothetical protein
LRFAVHGPGFPVAFPRSHGVPRRDVSGRIQICVAGETAGRAHEARLALARLRIHVPACRASLTGERGTYLLHPAGHLVLQSAYQQPPARCHDLAVEPGFLADIPARIPGRAPGRARHVSELEIFDSDHVKLARDVGGDLLGPVLAGIRLAGSQPGYGQLHSASSVRPRPSAGEPALEASQPFLASAAQSWHGQQLAGRQGSTDSYSAVDADSLSISRACDRARDSSKGDVPAPGAIAGDSVRLGVLRYCAGPTEPHPSGLRDTHQANIAGRAADVPVLPPSSHDTESFISVGFPPRWPARRVCWVEGGRHRLGEVAQGLLLHHLGASSQPRVLGAGGRELTALFQVAWGTLPARARVPVLLDGQVPHVPGLGAVVTQCGLLDRRWKQTIAGHANTLATTTDISIGGEARSLPDLSGWALRCDPDD